MPIKGESRKFEGKYAFQVDIDGIGVTHFSKCSELSTQIEVIKHREGGGTVPEIQLGLVNIPDITLERGAVSADSDLFDWFNQAISTVANKGLEGSLVKRDLDIVVLRRDLETTLRWRCFDCLPIEFVYGEWDSEASEVTITKIKIAITSIDRIPA